MKKTLIVKAVLFVSLVLTVCIFCLYLKKNSGTPNVLPAVKTDACVKTDDIPSINTQTETKEKYTVKEYGEKIGIFREGAGKPFYTIDVFVFTLPAADQSMLQNGFCIYKQDLQSVFEDYTG